MLCDFWKVKVGHFTSVISMGGVLVVLCCVQFVFNTCDIMTVYIIFFGGKL